MRKLTFLLLLAVFIFSCNDRKTGDNVAHKDSSAMVFANDTGTVKKEDSHYFWTADLAPKKGVMLTKLRPASADSLTAPVIIQMMNEEYPEIKLVLLKTSHDTVFVSIPKSKYLTRQMGSSGPEVYFAGVTYNLTEIKNINFVSFNFKEGDHAAPATYTRTDFETHE